MLSKGLTTPITTHQESASYQPTPTSAEPPSDDGLSVAAPTASVTPNTAQDEATDDQTTDSAINTIRQRAELHSLFMEVVLDTASANQAQQELRHAAESGNTLAGTYACWCGNIAEDIEPPPNAWAWQACQLYRQQANAGSWNQLRNNHSTMVHFTDMLELLAGHKDTELQSKVENWAQSINENSDNKHSSYKQMLARFGAKNLTEQRVNPDDIVLPLLQATAVGAPAFV